MDVPVGGVLVGCGVFGHTEKLLRKLPAQWKRRPAAQTGSLTLPTGHDKLFANMLIGLTQQYGKLVFERLRRIDN